MHLIKQASIKGKILKDVAKGELARATGGISNYATGGSRLYSAKDNVDAVKYMGKVPPKERNKPAKQMNPDKEALASLITPKVREAHEGMLDLEKEANSLGSALAFGAGTALGSAAAVGLVHGASNMRNKMKTERVWHRLKEEHPELTNSPKDRENFEVLQQFSPDIASNISTARGYMERAKQIGGVPHEFVGQLSDIQSKRDRSSTKQTLEGIASRTFTNLPYTPGSTKTAELQQIIDEVDPRL